MNLFLLLAAAAGFTYFVIGKDGVASAITKLSEPPEYKQIRDKVASDWQFFLNASPNQSPSNRGLVGDCFNPNPLGTNPVPSQSEIEQLSNCVEWASKCGRGNNGQCCDLIPSCSDGNTPHNYPGASDAVIINKSGDILVAVVAKRYSSATAEQQADIYLRTLEETVHDVRGFSFLSLIPILTLIAAPLTAGLSIAAAAGAASTAGLTGFSVVETAVLNTLATTIPAGIVTSQSIQSITGAPQGEADARTKLIQIYKSYKVIGV